VSKTTQGDRAARGEGKEAKPSSIVTYEHRYKPPPRKKPQAAKIEGPAVVTVTDPQLEKALREELVALEAENKRPSGNRPPKRKAAPQRRKRR
jgi:hypothetical protein